MKRFDEYLDEFSEVGYVEKVVQSLVYVNGLPTVKPEEIVVFESGESGQVLSLEGNAVEVLTFGKTYIRTGTRVARTGNEIEIPVGNKLLGRTLDPFCQPLDDTIIKTTYMEKRPIHNSPLGITSRRKIKKPFETGVAVVDMMVPLGHGQRELIMGDRKTGKTAFLLQTILTQAKKNTICIYAMIGKKKHDIKAIEEFFKKNHIFESTVLIASNPQDPAGVIYITPYTAITMAEYFRDQGKDVLLVLDDLSTHAKFYREISLTGKRFPGRDSYPGDIFHIHAKLLERAGNFVHPQKGESAITCLPVVETTEGDITGYMQTNLMSMTDGHIYFDTDLFYQGRRPAVNFFLSVTRVGHQTQQDVYRQISREMTSSLTLFEKLQNFIHFGAELSETTKNIFSAGDTILSFFNQSSHITIPRALQAYVFSLLWLNKGTSNEEKIRANIEKFIHLYKTNTQIAQQIDKIIESTGSFNELLGIIQLQKSAIMKGEL